MALNVNGTNIADCGFFHFGIAAERGKIMLAQQLFRGPSHSIQIQFTGNGFLHNMVRILVGTLIEVGRGQRNPESIGELFGGKRAEAGFLAPAQGLCLMEVFY